MLRTRILSTATTAFVLLALSVGGAGAAAAAGDPPTPIAVEVTGQPAAHPDGGATKVDVCHATPPDTAHQGWNLVSIDDAAAATNHSGHDHEHDADIIGAFSYWSSTGNGNDATWVYTTYPGKNLATDFGGVTGATILANGCDRPLQQASVATASIAVLGADCNEPTRFDLGTGIISNASWGTQFVTGGVMTIVATASVGSTFPAGDGVSHDGATKTFTAAHHAAGGDDCDATTLDCVVVIWQMPTWADQSTPTWPQTFVSAHDSDCATTPIDAELYPVPDVCGTQYQLDKYHTSEKTTALIAGGVLQGYGSEGDMVPGTLGTLVKNADCEIHRVVVPANAVPAELAVTGVESAAGWVGAIALLMTLVGVGIVGSRKRLDA